MEYRIRRHYNKFYIERKIEGIWELCGMDGSSMHYPLSAYPSKPWYSTLQAAKRQANIFKTPDKFYDV